MKAASKRDALGTLLVRVTVASVIALLAVGLLYFLLQLPHPGAIGVVHGQGADIYVDLTAGGGADPNVVGFVRNAYGEINPNGFITDAYAGTLQRLTWNSGTRRIQVILTAVPTLPLGQILIEGGDPYACESAGDRSFSCAYDEDADGSSPAEIDNPWIVGREYSVRMRFSDSVSGSTTFPDPTRQPDLPPGYATRDSPKDIALSGNSGSTKHLAFGGNYLYVRERNRVYAYNLLNDGARDTDREFIVTSTSIGLAYSSGSLWVIEDANDGSPPYMSSTLKEYSITATGSSGATTEVSENTMANTDVDNWRAYGFTSIGDGQFLVRYLHQGSGSTEYYWGRWHNYGGQNGDDVSTGLENAGTDTRGFAADPTGNLVWIQDTDIEDPINTGFNDNGAAAYRYDALVEEGEFVRLNEYDVWTQNIAPTGLGFKDDRLYPAYFDTSTRAAYAYQADSDLVYDRSTDFAQQPPTITSLEVSRAYQDDNAHLVDLSLVWTHTSTVGDGDTIMEYQFSSPVTGDIGPVRVSPFPTEHTISGLPRDSYNLELEIRYQWYNNQDPDEGDSKHVLIRNPPGAASNVCDDTNNDEFTSRLGNDDGIDATENADTDTPGCAFYLDPGTSRYSQWASVRTNIVGAAVGVEEPDHPPLATQDGLSGTIADILVVAGADAMTVGPLARTFTVLGWFVLSVGTGFALYMFTGFRTGSTYLGTFSFLVLWTGLGPFVAEVPPAMAYMPMALLILPIGMLLLKRGRV